jgi:SAM-dependent methyltransferase
MTSIVFTWDKADFDVLLASCQRGRELPFIFKYMPREGKILEAGCGLGRYVAYLADQGFDIEGIEINPETVAVVNSIRPDIRVHVGDVIRLPYKDNSLAGIISLGVIEHFIEGPQMALCEIWRVLKPEAYAIVTVPSFNPVRKMKAFSGYQGLKEKLKTNRILRRLFSKPPRQGLTEAVPFLNYHIYRQAGRFFEYRFSKREFESFLLTSGFVLVESVPIAQMDGLYHEFGRFFVSFRDWKFYPNGLGRWLNRIFSRLPFFHNHMHLCIVRKSPMKSTDTTVSG